MRSRPIRFLIAATAALAAPILAPLDAAQAFCGFYVSQAGADLFNDASKVVLVRDGERTVLTMANDYEGDPSEFAMVIPTPTVLQREQIHVGESALIDHLDAFTAPRMVEYFDDDPCSVVEYELDDRIAGAITTAAVNSGASRQRADVLGVTIEAEYTVGEYDILILSATESDGLQIWLDESGYKTPEAARDILGSYIAQGMKFFVARVNLEEQERSGGAYLRPLQIAFESEKFMLPIRLGTVNARGDQDLIVFTLTRTGRVETANYRTLEIPSNVNVPLFVQDEFDAFYKAMFETATARENGAAVFTEYAWDMGWCDPCAADPLSVAQLRELGVFWLGDVQDTRRGVDVYATRLHVRYNAETFPEDLRLHETGDRANFQGRYVTRHHFDGALACAAGEAYQRGLLERWSQEAQTLARLTGWDVAEIRAKMAAAGQDPSALPDAQPWWRSLWRQ